MKYYKAQSAKWKIQNVTPITSKQTTSENFGELEVHVIVLIVVGIVIGLVLIIALVLYIRSGRMYVFNFQYNFFAYNESNCVPLCPSMHSVREGHL